MKIKTVCFNNKRLRIIDQRLLPARCVYKDCQNLKDICDAIKTLAVRGAPAIGVFAAYGLYICSRNIHGGDGKKFIKKLSAIAEKIRSSRPTAVNLAWAIDRMMTIAYKRSASSVSCIRSSLLKEAKKINSQDQQMCRMIGYYGAKLIRSGDTILTHCNAGMLATSGEGSALSVIYRAKRQGKDIKVYADETRPLLQGARLTAWELKQHGIDVTLICDNMAAALMDQGKIDKVIVGADRIARNGDFANKIGTYNLAVIAKYHNIPFYVAAPVSTFDFKIKSAEGIPIEQRHPDEVKSFAGASIAPAGIKAYNPAFDITPANLVTAIITEKGILKKPYEPAIERYRRV